MPTIPFAGCFTSNSALEQDPRLAFIGLPDDSQSSFLQGAAAAPQAIRDAFDGRCYNSTTESGVDLAGAVKDLGNVRPGPDWARTYKAFKTASASAVSSGFVPFFAGGDHAVTVPVVDGLAVTHRSIHIIQIDAHPDIYLEYEGNRDSHACVVSRLLELEHVATVTQFGIRCVNAEQARELERHRDRVRVLRIDTTEGKPLSIGHIPEDAAVYLTIDLDGFDPAYAPGVSHPVPGGLTTRQVLDLVRCLERVLVGMDVVEVNPARDINGTTAILAARILQEGMGRALKQGDNRL
jgi:agmatinase